MRALCLWLSAVFATIATAENTATIVDSEQARFRLVTVATGLEFPWSLSFLPDGSALITERKSRRLRVLHDGILETEPVGGLPEAAYLEHSGLLEVAVDPGFERNRLVYLCYSQGTPERTAVRLVRGAFYGGRLHDVGTLLEADAFSRDDAQHGCRVAFDDAEHVFVTLGERYDARGEAQDLRNHMGKIVRLDVDGGIPADNPFTANGDARPEIWSYGVRNPQGLAWNPASRTLWEHEHGPRGGDELNVIRPGRNYGWPLATYGVDYEGAIISELTEYPGTESPAWYWLPSIAPSGMAFYTGDRFPRWRGDLFVGALARKSLSRLELDGERVLHEEVLLQDLGERVRDVRMAPDGLLYVLTDSDNGKVFRLEPVE